MRGCSRITNVEDARMDLPRWFGRSFRAQADARKSGQTVTPDLPRAPVLCDDAASITPQSDTDEAGAAREIATVVCAADLRVYDRIPPKHPGHQPPHYGP